MIRRPALAALALTGALAIAVAGTTATTAAAPSSHRAASAAGRGSPGHWTKVSTGKVDFAAESSLVRGGNGDVHLVYARDFSATSTGLMHTAIRAGGTVRSQNLVEQAWVGMDYTPALVRSSLGLRVLFAGTADSGSGFYDGNRIYTETSDDTGALWTLSPDAASNLQDDATSTTGTGAATLADGTPVVGFTHGDTLTWHIGADSDASPDFHYTAPVGTSLFNATLVRSGSSVWAAWFAVGQDAASTGTFAMEIYPIPLSPAPLKAPGSSNGTSVVHPNSRVALAARAGGGVYAAYCVGYPTCSSMRLWKVGTSQTATVPHSKGATRVAIAPGPSGRLWIAWPDGVQKIHAVRTSRSGMVMGAVRNAGQANGVKEVNSLAIEGSNGRGDIVVNVFGVLMHTQVFPGLSLHASPRRWQHGSRQVVHFTVTDARDPVKGARVKVGTAGCTTDGSGACSIAFPRSFAKGAHTARATRTGYGAASVVLRVR